MTRPVRQTYWILGAFVYAVLLLLVAVPLLLAYRQNTILSTIDRYADPADRAASGIQSALSYEVSALVGFQNTGEERYPYLYQDESAKIREALTELEEWAPRLGDEVQERLKESRAAIDQWHATIANYTLISHRYSAPEFQNLFFRHEYIVDHAHQATTNLSHAITTWRLSRRASAAGLNRFGAELTAVLALLAAVASLFLFKILRQLVSSITRQEERTREEEALRQVAHALTSVVALDDLLRRIAESASTAADADGVYVELVNAEEDQFTCVAEYGAGVPPAGTKGRYQGSLAEEVLGSGQPKIIPDVAVESEHRPLFGELARSSVNCSAMVVPLIADDHPLGALFLVRRHPQYFSAEEFSHVKILADMASLAIRRALNVETIRKMQVEGRFLSEASEVLASSLDYPTTLRTVVQLAVPRIADWCAIHLMEKGKFRTAEIAHTDPAKLRFVEALQEQYPPDEDHDGAMRVVRTGKSEMYPEIPDELLRHTAHTPKHYDLLRQLKLKSAMIVPLSFGTEVFGALTLATEEGGRRYGPDDLSFAEDIARHMALAIQNARLYSSAERAIQARDEVLRVVSHDLRNPVSNIQVTARMLASESSSEEKRQRMIDIISRTAVRMNRLLEDLIAVARIREGQEIPLNVQPDNPCDILDEACTLFGVQARSKSVELKCEKGHIVPTVMADRHRILQVLSNLLDNAIKFTPEGGRISVHCEPHGPSVRFEVSDTGRGIEPAHLQNIFDLFWQAKPTAYMGSGFGLAIAKTIIKQHGGKIWAESTPGVGTTFFFTLPQRA